MSAPLSNFGPRLGFAYQANNKLVVRGGAGIFFDRVGGDRIVYSVEQGNPYSATVDFNSFNNQTSGQSVPDHTGARHFLVALREFLAGLSGERSLAGCTSNLNIPFLAEVLHTPLIRQYNLGVQYQFAPQLGLEARLRRIELDQFDESVPQQQHGGSGESGPIQSTALRRIRLPTSCSGCRISATRRSACAERLLTADSNYNSLQVTVRKQFSRGFTFQGAYTWSKNMTNLANNQANSNNAGDLWQQYGPAQFSRPQRFVANYSYDLPFGTHSGCTGEGARRMESCQALPCCRVERQ